MRLPGRLGWLESPYRLLIRTSLALAVGAGFSLGLYLVLGFAFGWGLSAATPARCALAARARGQPWPLPSLGVGSVPSRLQGVQSERCPRRGRIGGSVDDHEDAPVPHLALEMLRLVHR